LNPVAIPARSEIIRSEISRPEISRRIFTPRSMMGSGIRSETAVPRVLMEDAAPETSLPPVSPLITAGAPKAVGALLARQGAQPLAKGGLRNWDQLAVAVVSAARASTDRLLAIRLSLGRVSVAPRLDLLGTRDLDRAHPCLGARTSVLLAATTDLATALVGVATPSEGSAGLAMVGGEAFLARALAGAGEVGALALDGRIGAATGDRAGRSGGILGGTTLIGMRHGRRTTTTRFILTAGTTIRRLTIPMLRMTTTHRQAT
jgi:hypothetical protein